MQLSTNNVLNLVFTFNLHVNRNIYKYSLDMYMFSDGKYWVHRKLHSLKLNIFTIKKVK